MDEGLYESLLTARSALDIASIRDLVVEIRNLDQAEQPEVLARHLHDAVVRRLSSMSSGPQRVELVNRVLADLEMPDDCVRGDVQQLMSLSRPASPGVPATSTVRPTTPLSDAALLTMHTASHRSAPNFGLNWRPRTRSTCSAPSLNGMASESSRRNCSS